MSEHRSLKRRLIAAGADPAADPLTAWQCLRKAEGARATVIDLYAIVARPRGLEPHQLPRPERAALARSIMPVVWPGFATTEGSAREGDRIEILHYDPDWPNRYDRWRERIQSTVGAAAVTIEHVGSTSVPGLSAKPIIDIQVAVRDLRDEPAYVPGLEQAGVQLRSRDDYHRYFRPFPEQPRDVHVHVCAVGSDWEREHLLFRDYLRAHQPARIAYAAAKRQAASVWSDDGVAYTDAKAHVILAIMDEAERWVAARE